MRLPKIFGETWFNSMPLNNTDLKGKVVLVDFFTYSCVNCQRTIPYLQAWWQRYGQRPGFIMIGIHTPEFEFEKKPVNVRQALRDLGIAWPVVMDNDFMLWNAFANHYWPAKYLANRDGKILYTHFGEGDYEKTEKQIQKLLTGTADDVVLIPKPDSNMARGKVCMIATPETYVGYARGAIANESGYVLERPAVYAAPTILPKNQIALAGSFVAHEEYAESAGAGAELRLHFSATEVNLVMHPGIGSNSAKVQVLLDEKPLVAELRGRDVASDGTVIITKPTLYNILTAKGPTFGILTIKSVSGIFQTYAFTFSGCEH